MSDTAPVSDWSAPHERPVSSQHVTRTAPAPLPEPSSTAGTIAHLHAFPELRLEEVFDGVSEHGLLPMSVYDGGVKVEVARPHRVEEKDAHRQRAHSADGDGNGGGQRLGAVHLKVQLKYWYSAFIGIQQI